MFWVQGRKATWFPELHGLLMMDSPYGPAAWTLLLCWALLPLPSMAHICPSPIRASMLSSSAQPRGQGAERGSHIPSWCPPVKQYIMARWYCGRVVLPGWESSKRKKQNINSKRFLSVGEESLYCGEHHRGHIRASWDSSNGF